MPDIWTECHGPRQIKPLSLSATRVVESQEQFATMGLVDNAEEQLILEQLIETVKPAIPVSRKRGKAYHYLIQTAFRYPPLIYGSRFGQPTEPGIFYASLEIRTALAETAWYRMLFWEGMRTAPTSGRIVTAHTSFEVTINTKSGIRLEQRAFSHFKTVLTHSTDYQTTQRLGIEMHEAGVEAFTFESARDSQRGINAGVFTIDVIIKKPPKRLRHWACTTMKDSVTFLNTSEPQHRYTF